MKAIVYFLLGATVGATLALLFSPASGQDLRASIQTAATSLVAADVEEEAVVEEAEAVDVAVEEADVVEEVEEDELP